MLDLNEYFTRTVSKKWDRDPWSALNYVQGQFDDDRLNLSDDALAHICEHAYGRSDVISWLRSELIQASYRIDGDVSYLSRIQDLVTTLTHVREDTKGTIYQVDNDIIDVHPIKKENFLVLVDQVNI